MINLSRGKIILILTISLLGILYALPNILPKNALQAWQSHVPSFLPGRTVNLGLDLQGGAQLLLQVDTQSAINDRVNAVIDLARSELRKANIGYLGGVRADKQTVSITLRDPAQSDAAQKILRKLDADFALAVNNDKLTLQYKDAGIEKRKNSALDQSIEIVRRRIDETGTKEPVIQRQGDDRIVVQLPGVTDPEHMKSLLGQTAKLGFHAVDADSDGKTASIGSMILPLEDSKNTGDQAKEPRMISVKKQAAVSGDDLTDAQPVSDPTSGEWMVSFSFNGIGAKRFGDITKDNVGRPFAIVLDNKVISAPVIREPIMGGRGQISGNFNAQSAQDLALLLRAGALPAPLKVIEERAVGPSLGSDSIQHGKQAAIIGMIAVMILAIVTYGRFGVMASITLLFNMIFIFAVLSLFQATLTLPGIAGIVLTIGMAVDANVLIFERIREESMAGRSPMSAIDAGFSRAMTAIIDTNLTAVISALALFFMGVGPVRGFAVTLVIGVITSMFAATMLTRLMVVTWLKTAKPKTLTI